VNGAELVQLSEAARAFGVSKQTLQARLEGGAVPEAVKANDSWSLPTRALAAIAEREGWPLDLTGQRPAPSDIPEQLDRYISETLAAHAAVVLAKTQATAARAESQEMARKLRLAGDDLDAERAERERVTTELTAATAAAADLDKQRAVAEARTDEIRQQLTHERSQRSYLAQRIGVLERERDELQAVLGWRGRRRLRRTKNG
jgi:DNA-binding XRE family transcriptional regulator